jgi:hypothetical protein
MDAFVGPARTRQLYLFLQYPAENRFERTLDGGNLSGLPLPSGKACPVVFDIHPEVFHAQWFVFEGAILDGLYLYWLSDNNYL